VEATDGETHPSETAGRFWLPGDERQVEGRLDWAPKRLVLDLDDWLTPPLRSIISGEIPEGLNVGPEAFVSADDSVEPNQVTVHGRLHEHGSVEVTLVDTMIAHRNLTIPGFRNTERRTATYALVGGLVDGADAHFLAARLRFRHLDAWARLLPRSLGAEQPVECIDLEQPGGRLTLRPMSAKTPVPGSGSGAAELLWSANDDQGLTFRELWTQLVNPLRTLLTLAVDASSPPTELHLQSTPHGDWLEVVDPDISNDAEPLPRSTSLLRRDDLNLAQAARWLAQFRTWSPVPSLVAAAVDKDSARPIELQVLDLAAAAEGLHRRLFDAQRTLSKQRARDVRDRVLSALADDTEAQTAVRQSLISLGEPTFHARLERLVERSKEAIPDVTGMAPNWIRRVKQARNGFAHLLINEEGLKTEPLENYVLKLSLRWVLGSVLLLESGVSADVLRERVAEHQPYQFLLQQAGRWLAEVYQPAENSG